MMALHTDVDVSLPGLNSYDAEQIRLMEENCILVDQQDNVVGKQTKKNCKKFL